MNKQLLIVSSMALALSSCSSTVGQMTSTLSNAAGTMLGGKVASEGGGFLSNYTINPALAGQDPLLASYGTSVILMFQAQEVWLSSIGNANGAAKLKAEREALESGAVIDGDLIERHAALSVETNALLKQSVADEVDLSDQGKSEFAAGWAPYLLGLYQSVEAAKQAGDYATSVAQSASNISLANAYNLVDAGRKGIVLSTLVTAVPEFLQMQYETFNLIVDYAKDQEIEVPDDANDALSDIEL